MRLISENEASELTGKDRKTVKRRLDGIQSEPGKHGARLYPSDQALEAIILGTTTVDGEKITTPEALRRLTIRKDADIALNMEIKRGERIPLDMVVSLLDETFQGIAAILKSTKGKRMEESTINEIFAKLRDLPNHLPSANAAANPR